MIDVYTKCPVYHTNLITLQKTEMNEAEDLLKCYSDEKAVPLFNSDNCHGDDFHYSTIERMKQAIEFWDFSYNNRYFVRWTVIINETQEKAGTIEMFHRIAEDEFNHFGVLRIDLQSRHETQPVIDNILQIANENFYDAFDVRTILTKAIPIAEQRRASLIKNGYNPLNKKVMVYDDYYVRSIE